MGRGADLPSLQCVDAPRTPASPSLAGACTVRPAGPHPAGRLAQAPPHLSPLWAGRTPASLPAGAPVLASHLSSVAFSLEQPRPSPECALPRLSPLVPDQSRLASFRGSGEGSPLPTSFSPRGTRFPYPAPTPQHSGDGGGGARLQLPFVPRGMAETRRPCWASQGGRTARGAGLFRETPVLRCAGSLGARAERVGRGRPFLEESRPTGFLFAT